MNGKATLEEKPKVAMSLSTSSTSSNTSTSAAPASTSAPEVCVHTHILEYLETARSRMLIFHNDTFAGETKREGFEWCRRTISEHVAATGQGTSSQETLQQESPADGMEQKKRALQQPLSLLCASPLTRFFKMFFLLPLPLYNCPSHHASLLLFSVFQYTLTQLETLSHVCF